MKLFTTLLTAAIMGLCSMAHCADANTPQTSQGKPSTSSKNKTVQGNFKVTSVDPSGQFVTLENGIKYEVNKRYAILECL